MGYYADLMKEVLNNTDDFDANTISLCDDSFIILVLTYHYLSTQSVQFNEIQPQLGGLVLIFLLGVDYEGFLIMYKILGRSNFLFEIL
jgi:hypothetical protein